MNILYLHGLNGSLSLEKKTILEQYGNVYAPSIDYENEPNSISDIIAQYHNISVNVVIGSSMGGFAGYYVANQFQCPALLFNPALLKRSVKQNIPEIKYKISSVKRIVLGTEDNVVNPKETLQFLANTIDFYPNYNLHVRNQLAHRIPITVFKEEVNIFFNELGDS
ncbi:YqiA/YcfP family alpha/beta fold hydrolase [uncultured Formosa sp.]|uniref:YqiA/YcfP family alpha/beta fold hydrolase n=1 Tax=uncultured Formosa sp. TaxID=255435 RepID=UPI002624E19D|nr:YqiA/YcfP family alpha/beta fold hydrolase [uncultured Formosa sp.]